MMWFISFLMFICLKTANSRSVPTDGNPNCLHGGCPRYTVVEKFGDDLELRCFMSSVWVSISGRGKLYVQSHNLPTWKLQKYIGGNNAKLQQVPIGSLTSKLFDETQSVYTEEYFILDSVNKTNIPRAVDPAVRVIYRPAFCAYVYGFKGWMDGYEILPKYRTMAKDLIRKNVAQEIFYDDFFFYVNYPGFPYIPRYNEIWYIVKLDIVEQRREQQRYPGNN